MTLKAKKPSEIKRLKKLKTCVFGKPGVGKTWFFSLEFPKVYYIDSESGANLPAYLEKLERNGGVYMGTEDGTSDFQTVISELKQLATVRHDYETVVITLSKLWINEIGKAQEKSKNIENDYGAYKRPAISYMRQLMNWTQRIDMHVIFECHEVGEWETIGKERHEVGQIPDYYQKFDHELDITFRLIRNPEPSLVVKKTRLSGFPKGEIIPCKITELKSRLGDLVTWENSKPIELISSEQLEELNHLLSIFILDEKEKDRWLSKANANEWSELNTQQAAAAINWLKGKIA